METIDLTTCPHCHATPLRVASVERIYGIAGINLFAEDGAFTAEWGGGTDMDWDSSRTLAFHCVNCGADLPEAYATVLDGLLGVERIAESGQEGEG